MQCVPAPKKSLFVKTIHTNSLCQLSGSSPLTLLIFIFIQKNSRFLYNSHFAAKSGIKIFYLLNIYFFLISILFYIQILIIFIFIIYILFKYCFTFLSYFSFFSCVNQLINHWKYLTYLRFFETISTIKLF